MMSAAPCVPPLVAPLAAAAAVLAMLVAGGCTVVTPHREPEVRSVDRSTEIAFAPASAALTPPAVRQLRAFLIDTGATAAGAAGQSVFVVGAASVGDDPDSVARLIDRRNRAVADLLAAEGIAVQPLPADAGGGPPAPDTVRVTVRSTVVILPGCPDWRSWPNYSTFHNQPVSDWSCSTAVNLGMMVATPADLVRGRVPGDADGTVAARSIENYRKGKTKPLLDDVSTAETFAAGGAQ